MEPPCRYLRPVTVSTYLNRRHATDESPIPKLALAVSSPRPQGPVTLQGHGVKPPGKNPSPVGVHPYLDRGPAINDRPVPNLAG